MELLSVENVTFRYPNAASDALRDVSFSVSEGQWAILCGLSGCGKSTLLRLIKHELAPYGKFSGRILFRQQAGSDSFAVLSENVSGAPALPRVSDRESAESIGIVMQDPESQLVTDTVWHELAFGLENLGLPSETIRRRVAEMAGFFGMESWYHRKTYELSGGQKQLLNLASTLAMNPRLLLLDEPTAQLDPIAAADFRNVLQRVNRELGVTILMAEHRLESVLPLADRIFLMDRGAILQSGDAAGLVKYLSETSHAMSAALPTATRVYLALAGSSVVSGETTTAGDDAGIPLTVRDGRAMLRGIPCPAGEKQKDGEHRIPSEETAKAFSAKESAAVLSSKNVRFRYDRNLPDVLAEASLSLRAGEHYCLLGGNGSGKTTFLAVLAGLLKPYAGAVHLFDKKMSAYAPGTLYRNNLALLPQQPRDVFTEKTIREDLEKAFLRDAESESSNTMNALCERLGITGILDSHPYDVSGGELQKAALAKVLASRPKVLLLDEPTKGIDVRGKQELADILSELTREGTAVLTVTHDAEWAAEHADRCGLLFDGQVISEDAPGAFFDGNAYYTTAANRMTRGILPGCVTVDDILNRYRGEVPQ